MKVGELIKELERVDQNRRVVVRAAGSGLTSDVVVLRSLYVLENENAKEFHDGEYRSAGMNEKLEGGDWAVFITC